MPSVIEELSRLHIKIIHTWSSVPIVDFLILYIHYEPSWNLHIVCPASFFTETNDSSDARNIYGL